jgi:type 1 fimbriae regulatory protein FimE
MSNIAALPARRRRRPDTENRKVLPKRLRNADRRPREYLAPDEVRRLIDQAGKLGRHSARDAALLTLAYRHGLRVSELVALRWDMVDLKQGLLHVSRMKNGIPSVQPLRGPELRALRRLARDYPDTPYVFVTERKGPSPQTPCVSWSSGPAGPPA